MDCNSVGIFKHVYCILTKILTKRSTNQKNPIKPYLDKSKDLPKIGTLNIVVLQQVLEFEHIDRQDNLRPPIATNIDYEKCDYIIWLKRWKLIHPYLKIKRYFYVSFIFSCRIFSRRLFRNAWVFPKM